MNTNMNKRAQTFMAGAIIFEKFSEICHGLCGLYLDDTDDNVVEEMVDELDTLLEHGGEEGVGEIILTLDEGEDDEQKE